MIVSEITYPSGQTAIKIQPESEYKYVSNGEIWSNPEPDNNYIILGKTDSVDNWHDTNDEPPTPEPEPTGDDIEQKAEAFDYLTGRSGDTDE